MSGRAYSANKDTFKDILKKHGLRWRGSFDDPWWGSGSEKVSAVYERDEVRNITVSASLTWDGAEGSPFLEELREWASGVGASEEEVRISESRSFMEDLMFFEMVYKPQINYLESTGRPRTWIEKDLKRWEEERMRRFGDENPNV